MAGTETILAPRADAPTKPGAVALRGPRPFENDVAKPRLKVLETVIRVLEEDNEEGAERAGENEEVAAAIKE